MSLQFVCPLCREPHFSYTHHFTHGRVCPRCNRALMRGENPAEPAEVRMALRYLNDDFYQYAMKKIQGENALGRRWGLKDKARGLVRHDRYLCENHRCTRGQP